MTDKKISIFDCTDAIIHYALGGDISSKKFCNNLCNFTLHEPLPEPLEARVVPELFDLIEKNLDAKPPFRKNWRGNKNWRDELRDSVDEINIKPEDILNRAIARLAKWGEFLPDKWTNEIPVASGLTDGHSERADLARVNGDTADLIELKWKSNNPLSALFQVLRYGLALLLCRKYAEKFGYTERALIKAKTVNLIVLAPAEFYKGYNTDGINKFAVIIQEGLGQLCKQDPLFPENMTVQFMQFPEGFKHPFQNGKEVNDMEKGDEKARYLADAVNNIHPIGKAAG